MPHPSYLVLYNGHTAETKVLQDFWDTLYNAIILRWLLLNLFRSHERHAFDSSGTDPAPSKISR